MKLQYNRSIGIVELKSFKMAFDDDYRDYKGCILQFRADALVWFFEKKR